MSIRHLGVIFVTVIISMWCYAKADQDGFATAIVDAMKMVRMYYVDEVDSRDLFENAMRGMVAGSLDQYSGYISPDSFRQVEQDLDQEFGGVGIEIEKKVDAPLLVLSPLVNSPAYRGGLRAGDQILEIDGQATEKMTSEEAVALMRGRPGESVVLKIQHMGEDETLEVTVVREVITVQSVLGDVRGPDGIWDYHLTDDESIGYLRITTFGKHTAEELRAVLANRDNLGFEALILDLRNNAGGLLNAAVETCDLFIDQGAIVSTRGRDSIFARTYEATPETAVGPGMPVAVLVNGFSASASEIVAACLQDYDRAAIVGQRTWGKGTVQNILPMEGGRSALRLTTATYWRPSGENIHRSEEAGEDADWGVRPDPQYEVVLDEEELEKLIEERRRRDLIDEVRNSAERVDGDGIPENILDNDPSDPQTDRDAENGADEGAIEEGPAAAFEDRQLKRAMNYLREQLSRPPALQERPAAA